jgi:DNA-binding LytR/AlgR family response regulator
MHLKTKQLRHQMSAPLSPFEQRPTAIIAEDEPLLAKALKDELAKAWPELQVISTVGDGISAVKQALALKPDLLFFDIRMPGLSGLEAAAELADVWKDGIFPSLVFVTAYDQYALQAFDAHAVDYLLKPVQPQRLQQTVVKLRLAGLNSGNTASENVAIFDQTLGQLRHLIASDNQLIGNSEPLKFIKVNIPTLQGAVRMVAIEEILYFEAADKYVQVIARDGDVYKEHLIRMPLKELIPQLDSKVFWQIHRGTIVRASAINTLVRDEAGKLMLTLRGHTARLAVSRLYAHLFKGHIIRAL